CYIAGPGEINYYAQVGALYPLFGLEPPIIAPRARLRVIEPATRRLLGQLGLSPADAELPREELVRRLAAAQTEFPKPDDLRGRLLDSLLRALDDMDAMSLDPSLHDPIKRTRETIEHAAQRLLDRYARALTSRDEIAGARLDRLQTALAPGGVPHERFLPLPPLLARHGVRAFTQRVLESIRPFDAAIVDLSP